MKKKNPYAPSNHKPFIELVMRHDTAEQVLPKTKRDKKWQFATFKVNGKELPNISPVARDSRVSHSNFG